MRRGWATGHRPRRKLPQVPPEQAVAESREDTCSQIQLPSTKLKRFTAQAAQVNCRRPRLRQHPPTQTCTRAVLRTVPRSDLPQALTGSTSEAQNGRCWPQPLGAGGLESSSAEPPENILSKSRMKSDTTGAPEATVRRSPHSALALELVDQFRLPTMRSAVVSPTTSKAFAWCSPFRPAPTVAPLPSERYASRTE